MYLPAARVSPLVIRFTLDFKHPFDFNVNTILHMKTLAIIASGGKSQYQLLRPLSYALLITCLLTITACQPVEISRTKPWWEENTLSSGGANRPTQGSASAQAGIQPQGTITAVTQNPDGSITLNTPLPVYLINHLYNALIAEKYDIIFDQLISDKAKQIYQAKNRDPREIIDWFKTNRRDIIALLTRMNRGFNSLDVVWSQQGGTFRMKLTGRTAQDMRYTIMDITREGSQFRLILIK